MKKRVYFSAYFEFECDEDYNPQTFEDAEDADYDSIGRPIERLEDEGWEITDTGITIVDGEE